MARRRLLSILAGSALLTASFAGPAAAVELVDASQEPVAEVSEEPVEVADQVVEDVEDVVGAVVDEPAAEVTQVIEETVAPEPGPEPKPEPTPAPTSPADEEPAAPAAASSDEPSEALVAAGDVTAAPSLAFLTGTGGSAPTGQSRLELPSLTGAVDTAPPVSEAVPAPQVAPAPAVVADTPAPYALAQVASRAVDDEGTPIVVLVAIASLLAAGFSTVREARAVAV